MIRYENWCPYCDAGIECDHLDFNANNMCKTECDSCGRKIDVEAEYTVKYIVYEVPNDEEIAEIEKEGEMIKQLISEGY